MFGFNFGTPPAVTTAASPPTASGLSPWAAQVLGGMGGVNWTDLFTRLMGGMPGPSLADLMMPAGGIPQLGPVVPPPAPTPVAPPVSPPVMPKAKAKPQVNRALLPLAFTPDSGGYAGGYGEGGLAGAGDAGIAGGYGGGVAGGDVGLGYGSW